MIKKYNFELVSQGIAQSRLPLARINVLVFLFLLEVISNTRIAITHPFVLIQCLGQAYAAHRFLKVKRVLDGLGDIDSLMTRQILRGARPGIYKIKYAKFMSLLGCFLLLLRELRSLRHGGPFDLNVPGAFLYIGLTLTVLYYLNQLLNALQKTLKYYDCFEIMGLESEPCLSRVESLDSYMRSQSNVVE